MDPSTLNAPLNVASMDRNMAAHGILQTTHGIGSTPYVFQYLFDRLFSYSTRS